MDEYKLVVAGESNVGKSAVTIQFVQGLFVAESDPTIEDSYRKQCVIDDKVGILDILDTAPHEEFSVMREQFMRTGEGFLLVYSVIDKSSFNQIHKYHKQILKVKDSEDIPMVIVANKTDLDQIREVSSQDGRELAKILKVGYVETSARLSTNVDKAFFDLVRAIRKHRNPELESSITKKTGRTGRGKCTVL